MPSPRKSITFLKKDFVELVKKTCGFSLVCYSVGVGDNWQDARHTANERQKIMAIKAIQSSKFDFTVEAVPSFHQLPDGSFVKDGFTSNRRTDTFEVLGKVTDRYGLVQNGDLVDAAETAFKAAGLANFERRIIVTGIGEKFYAEYRFKSHIKKIAKVGDEVGMRLILQNSFDGSLRASFIAGLLRLLCLNGMIGAAKQFGLTQKHGSKISVGFVGDALQKAMAAFDASTLIFERMAQVELTQAQGHVILANLQAQRVMSDKMREAVAGIWSNPTHAEDSARSLYNLYNAVTQHLTHDVSGERFELANRVSENTLSIFERVTRDANRFAKLVTPLPTVTVEAVEV